MSCPKYLVITGATGKQGRSVVQSLLKHRLFDASEHSIAIVTRDPESQAARALCYESSAIRAIQGDFTNPSAIFKSLHPGKPWAAYIMTVPGKTEVVNGTGMIDAAIKAGVSHIVLSTVDRGTKNGGNCPSDVAHWQTKHEIEAHLRRVVAQNSTLTYTILRPVFFMDNLDPSFFGKVCSSVWKDFLGRRSLKLVDTRDIGTFAAAALLEPNSDAWRNVETTIAGDELTYAQANALFREHTGHDIPVTWKWLTSLLRLFNKDFEMMCLFLREQGYGGEPGLPRGCICPSDFQSWIIRNSTKFGK